MTTQHRGDRKFARRDVWLPVMLAAVPAAFSVVLVIISIFSDR